MSISSEKSRQSAQRAKDYVRKFNLRSTTHPSFAGLSKEDQISLSKEFAEVRLSRNLEPVTVLGLDMAMNDFAQGVANSKNVEAGNCVESAYLALDYVLANEPQTRAEIFVMPTVDHVFCVINRDQNSNSQDPATWGDKAYICDPWENTVYSASELCKSRDYKFSKIVPNPTATDIFNEELILNDVKYEPTKDPLLNVPSFSTDHLREISKYENPNTVVNLYKEKSNKIVSALESFEQDLNKLKHNLKADDKKAQVIANKIKDLNREIGKIKNKINQHSPNAEDYLALRAELSKEIK